MSNDYLYDLMRGLEGTEQPDGVLDLGNDFRIMFQTRIDDGPAVGFLNSHRVPGRDGCAGSVIFDVPAATGLTGPRWQVVSMEPLHIEPSVLCRACGSHGFIRAGRWEPC